MGRDSFTVIILYHISDFNSHARVGRDQILEVTAGTDIISTHTPAWGVTTSS